MLGPLGGVWQAHVQLQTVATFTGIALPCHVTVWVLS